MQSAGAATTKKGPLDVDFTLSSILALEIAPPEVEEEEARDTINHDIDLWTETSFAES